MNVLVLGGDLRYLEIIDSLKSKYDVSVVGYKNACIDGVSDIDISDVSIGLYDVVILPVNGVMEDFMINCRFNNTPIKLSEDFFVGSKDDVLIFSGIPTPCLDKMLRVSDRDCVYMMKDKDVIKKNAIPTAEGVLADVINNTECTLDNSRILVFGYGNTGKVIVDYLRYFNSDICVAIIEDKDKKILDGFGVKCFYSDCRSDLVKSIGSSDVIINTVPNNIISDDLVKYINRDCYILDIASHPHGFDREVLDEFFIKNKLYLGIPGKVAPKTSGKILCKKINDVIGD